MYLQGSSGDADIEDRPVDRAGEGESGMETYALPCVKQRASGNVPCDSGNSVPCSVTPRGVTRGWGEREVQDGEDRCIPTADLC